MRKERRLVTVSTFFLEMMLRGELRPAFRASAPPDLRIVGVGHVERIDPATGSGAIDFVVESASFEPLPPGVDPHIVPTYSVRVASAWGPLRWWRRFRAAWRAA